MYGSTGVMYGSTGSHGMSTAIDIIAPILGIAAIAGAIVLFIKFASKKADKTKPLTKFFSFDHLFNESITKFLYVFSTTSIAAFCLILPFMSAASKSGVRAMGAFFEGLIIAVFAFVIFEVVNRLLFEWSMMFIRGAVDLHDIRNKMLGSTDSTSNDSIDLSGIFAAKRRSGNTPTDKAEQSAAQPSQPAQPAQPTVPISPVAASTWDCPCGKTGNAGSFCPKCGHPRP